MKPLHHAAFWTVASEKNYSLRKQFSLCISLVVDNNHSDFTTGILGRTCLFLVPNVCNSILTKIFDFRKTATNLTSNISSNKEKTNKSLKKSRPSKIISIYFMI